MQQTNEKKLLVLSFLGVLTFIAVVVGATYAYFTAQGGGTGNINVNATTNTTDNLSFQVGEAINLTANEEDFGSGMGNKSGETYARAILTANNATNNATANYYIYLDIQNNDFEYTTEDNQAELLLKVTAPDGSEVTTLGSLERKTSGEVTGFDITTQTGLITIADNYEITSTGTETQEWKIEVIFVNLDSDQNKNTGKTFNATLIVQEDELDGAITSQTLASYITSLYTTDGENGLYYHDGQGTYTNANQEAGDNSYRYAGANPNNYVCFGSNEESCPSDNLYRIIGVFNGQVKLIKAISYGEYSWGDNENINTWNTDIKPDIYTTLNNLFYNSLGIEWQDLISLHDYNVEGMSQNDSFGVKQYYDAEIKNNNGYNQNMKIGLMYVTDYGYAASPEAWTIEMFNYDDSKNINWLSGITEWTISRRADVTGYTFRIDESGYVRGDYYVAFAFSIRPSFYLNSDVEIYEGHAGTVSDPYRIVI